MRKSFIKGFPKLTKMDVIGILTLWIIISAAIMFGCGKGEERCDHLRNEITAEKSIDHLAFWYDAYFTCEKNR